MAIGNRKQIKLINETPTLTGGNWVTSSTTILRAWAEIRSSSGFRSVYNGQAAIGRFFEFRFRHRGDTIDVTADTRLVYDGEKYAIHSVEKEKGGRFYWIVRCQAKDFS